MIRLPEKPTAPASSQAEPTATIQFASSGSVCLVDRWWKIGLCGVLLTLLFREELVRLIDRWVSDSNESHGFLIPAFSLYFVYRERTHLKETAGKASWWGLVVILLSLFAYLVSVFKGFYYPRQVLMIVALGGVVFFQGGWGILRLTWLPIVFLIFAMPLPAGVYYNITLPMRMMASTVAAVILSLLPDVTCEAMNVVIHGWHGTEPIQLNVAEACSGMHLLLAFLALGVAMAYLEPRPILHRIILLLSTIPIAIFCNMVRVLLTGLIYIYIGSEWATGDLHTLLGMCMLVLAFGLYGLLAWIMSHIFVAEDGGEILVVQTNKDSG